MLLALRTWSARRWWVAAAAWVVTALVVAVPTAMIPNPVFGREIPTTWWAWPTLVLTAVLGGLLVATYVREPGAVTTPSQGLNRRGTVGGLLSFFAVGCPVCNKLALIALGYTGALQWFAPVQPVLAVGGVVLLGWALRARLRGQLTCPVAPAPESAASPESVRA
jgi:hypothetical protein